MISCDPNVVNLIGVLYCLTGSICAYSGIFNEAVYSAPQRMTIVESEASHEATMAKNDMSTEIPAYLVRQTRTPSVFTLDSPEGRQKMMGIGKEARHIFHGGFKDPHTQESRFSQRSMSVDFVNSQLNRRRKLSFPTDLAQITEELDDKRSSGRTNRSYFDDFAEQDKFDSKA